jgi:FkbM family methyltransferase
LGPRRGDEGLIPLYRFRKTPIVKRLLPSLCKLWRRKKVDYTVTVRNGIAWLLYPQSIVDRDLLIWGDWEAEQKAILIDAAHRHGADVFLDIGACFGLYALTIKKEFPNCEVHAFEPHPTNRRQLEANILINPTIGNISVHDHALGERREKLGIRFQSNKNRGAARLDNSGLNDKSDSALVVDVLPLDDVLSYRDRTIVVKIDVEGGENPVLRGMRKLVDNNKCFMQIECLPGQDQEAFLALLAEMNLRLVSRVSEDYFVTNF